MVSVRAATVEDAEGIAHVHVQSWRTTYAGIVPQAYLAGLNEAERVTLWREWLTRGIEVHVAEMDGSILGFISGGAIREPLQPYDAELFALYLLEQVQRRGIGTELLKELAGSLRKKSFTSMAVWVLERNPATQFMRSRELSFCAPRRSGSAERCWLKPPTAGRIWMQSAEGQP